MVDTRFFDRFDHFQTASRCRYLIPFLLLVVIVGIAGAVPISVTTDGPGTVSPGEQTTLTYEITNEGAETSAALGLEMQSTPANVTVESIETDTGTVAPEQNAVFWTEPIEPGETVSVTFELSVDQRADAATHQIRTKVSSSTDSTIEETELVVETERVDSDGDRADSTDDAPSEDTDGILGVPVESIVVAGVAALAVLYVIVRLASTTE